VCIGPLCVRKWVLKESSVNFSRWKVNNNCSNTFYLFTCVIRRLKNGAHSKLHFHAYMWINMTECKKSNTDSHSRSKLHRLLYVKYWFRCRWHSTQLAGDSSVTALTEGMLLATFWILVSGDAKVKWTLWIDVACQSIRWMALGPNHTYIFQRRFMKIRIASILLPFKKLLMFDKIHYISYDIKIRSKEQWV